jgi:excisionase family DNA binding protein
VLSIALPTVVVDEIVDRVAERVLAAGASGVEPWVRVADVAAHLACRRQRIYDLVGRRGRHQIPHRRDGTRLLFRLSEVDAWLAGE